MRVKTVVSRRPASVFLTSYGFSPMDARNMTPTRIDITNTNIKTPSTTAATYLLSIPPATPQSGDAQYCDSRSNALRTHSKHGKDHHLQCNTKVETDVHRDLRPGDLATPPVYRSW